MRLISQERDFYRKSIQYSINTPFGQTVMPENRKTVLLDTLENYRHVAVNDNMRFIVECSRSWNARCSTTGSAPTRPPISSGGPTIW